MTRFQFEQIRKLAEMGMIVDSPNGLHLINLLLANHGFRNDVVRIKSASLQFTPLHNPRLRVETMCERGTSPVYWVTIDATGNLNLDIS